MSFGTYGAIACIVIAVILATLRMIPFEAALLIAAVGFIKVP